MIECCARKCLVTCWSPATNHNFSKVSVKVLAVPGVHEVQHSWIPEGWTAVWDQCSVAEEEINIFFHVHNAPM